MARSVMGVAKPTTSRVSVYQQGERRKANGTDMHTKCKLKQGSTWNPKRQIHG